MISFTVILTAGLVAEKKRVPAGDIVIEAVVAETERSTEWDGLWEETTTAATVTETAVQTSVTAAEAVTTDETVIDSSEFSTSQNIAAEVPASGGLVNINTAAASELETLPGIGEKTAQSIIEYRESTPFQRIEDIMNVSGIGEKKFEDMKDMICV